MLEKNYMFLRLWAIFGVSDEPQRLDRDGSMRIQESKQ